MCIRDSLQTLPDLVTPLKGALFISAQVPATVVTRRPQKGVGTNATVEATQRPFIVQELCESRGCRPGLSVRTSLLVSVNVKLY